MAYDISKLLASFPLLSAIKPSIMQAFELIKQTFTDDGIIYVCGNGGSAADAEHMVGELMKGFLLPRPIDPSFNDKLTSLYGDEGSMISSNLQEGIKAISLNGHPSLATAFGNDVDFSMIFAQQVYVLGKKGDLLIVFSTSGNSENIVKALQVAKAKGLKTIVFTGSDGGRCAELTDCCIKVPETETYRIQEYHLPIYHALCAMLEDYCYSER